MKLPGPFTDDKKTVHAIVETPKGSRTKYSYDEQTGLFKLKKALPAGTTFPLDFGFIPGTQGEDGDPLDILIMMEDYSYPGCLIECRVIGIIEAEQKERSRKVVRNDRIVAVSLYSRDYQSMDNLKDMEKREINDWAHFFEYYNSMEGKKFELLGIKGPHAAMKNIMKHCKK